MTPTVSQITVEPLLRAKGFKQDRYLKDHFHLGRWWKFWNWPCGGPLIIIGQFAWAYSDTWGNRKEGSSTESLIQFLRTL